MKFSKYFALSILPILCIFTAEPALKSENISAFAQNYVRKSNINEDGKIKNVIMFIGDGMGPNHVSAAEVYKGSSVSFSNPSDERWTYHGYQNTDSLTSNGFTLDTTKSLLDPEFNSSLYDGASNPYGSTGNFMSNSCYTDSAAAGTALATGRKTNNANIGVGPLGDTYENLVEIASKLNKKTGVISTDKLVGATPSSFLVHVPERHLEDEILNQVVNSPADLIITETPGNWSSTYETEYKNKGWSVSNSITGLNKENEKELCLIDHLIANSPLAPSLTDLTMYALDKLDNENGFFLMVEASEIDKASHSNQAGTAIRELLELDQTVEMVTQWVGDRDDTLIVVTADHETGALYYNENTSTKQNIFDNIKFLSQNHSRTRVTVDVFGKIDEFIEEYKVELSAQGPLDKGLPTENKNYWQNTDVFKLCVSYL